MSRHLHVERLPSGLFFSSRVKKRTVKDYSKEVGLTEKAGPSKKIVYQGQESNKGLSNNIGVGINTIHFAQHIEPGGSSVNPGIQFPEEDSDDDDDDGKNKSLQSDLQTPLLGVSVDVLVDDIITHTTLTQTFKNTFEETIEEVRYVFPLYDGAVVTSFRCTVGQERILIGEVKPKQEAVKIYKDAVKKKEVAALLQEQTPEIFETVIGNLPAETLVTVELTYVNELKVVLGPDAKEGLCLIIPLSIAPRYTQRSKEYTRHMVDLKSTGLEIVVRVNNDEDHVHDIVMESYHEIETKLDVVTERHQVVANLFDLVEQETAPTLLKQAVATYRCAEPRMRDDFALIIQTRDTWPIRSRALISNTNEEGQAAMMLNLKPSDLIGAQVDTASFDGEVIFVLDRSGSMEGSKIRTLRNAVPASLVSLQVGCAINVVSFGSNAEFLWENSQEYSPESLQAARNYTSGVDATMGGTELLNALQEVVKSRRQDRSSMQIIIVTDGEVDLDEIGSFVHETRQELNDKIRFFALGIGQEVSHYLIEFIGEFGGGYGEVVDIKKNKKWANRLVQMLKGAMMPHSWTFDVDLGEGFKRQSLLDYKLGDLGRSLSTKTGISYIQAPYPTPALHPFAYRSVFFLFDFGVGGSKEKQYKRLPSQIELRPRTSVGMKETATLTVQTCHMYNDTLNHLTAKAILQSLEIESTEKATTQSQIDKAKENAEYLGTLYSIASKWTSFVAVDKETQQVDEVDLYKADLKPFNEDHAQLSDYEYQGYASPEEGSPDGPEMGMPVEDELREYEYISLVRTSTALDMVQSSNPLSQSTSNLGSSSSSSIQSEVRMEGGSDVPMLQGRGVPSLSSCRSPRSLIESSVDAPPEAVPAGNPLARITQSYPLYDSDSISEEESENTISWEEVVSLQDAWGMIRLDRTFRARLASHFCSNTAKVLTEFITSQQPFTSGSELRVPDIHLEPFVDTLMIVHYFETHMLKEREVWEMWIDKAMNVVRRKLSQFGNEEFVSRCQSILTSAMIHAHFYCALEERQDVGMIGFPYTKIAGHCRVCLVSNSRSFDSYTCPHPSCMVLGSDRVSWDDLWKHQMEQGHLVCPHSAD